MTSKSSGYRNPESVRVRPIRSLLLPEPTEAADAGKHERARIEVFFFVLASMARPSARSPEPTALAWSDNGGSSVTRHRHSRLRYGGSPRHRHRACTAWLG